MGNVLEKARQTDGSGKKELKKGGRDKVYTSARLWGSTFLNEAESEDFWKKRFYDFVVSFQERYFILGSRFKLFKSQK